MQYNVQKQRPTPRRKQSAALTTTAATLQKRKTHCKVANSRCVFAKRAKRVFIFLLAFIFVAVFAYK